MVLLGTRSYRRVIKNIAGYCGLLLGAGGFERYCKVVWGHCRVLQGPAKYYCIVLWGTQGTVV